MQLCLFPHIADPGRSPCSSGFLPVFRVSNSDRPAPMHHSKYTHPASERARPVQFYSETTTVFQSSCYAHPRNTSAHTPPNIRSQALDGKNCSYGLIRLWETEETLVSRVILLGKLEQLVGFKGGHLTASILSLAKIQSFLSNQKHQLTLES